MYLSSEDFEQAIADSKKYADNYRDTISVEIGVDDDGFTITEIRDAETNDVIGFTGVIEDEVSNAVE